MRLWTRANSPAMGGVMRTLSCTRPKAARGSRRSPASWRLPQPPAAVRWRWGTSIRRDHYRLVSAPQGVHACPGAVLAGGGAAPGWRRPGVEAADPRYAAWPAALHPAALEWRDRGAGAGAANLDDLLAGAPIARSLARHPAWAFGLSQCRRDPGTWLAPPGSSPPSVASRPSR